MMSRLPDALLNKFCQIFPELWTFANLGRKIPPVFSSYKFIINLPFQNKPFYIGQQCFGQQVSVTLWQLLSFNCHFQSGSLPKFLNIRAFLVFKYNMILKDLKANTQIASLALNFLAHGR